MAAEVRGEPAKRSENAVETTKNVRGELKSAQKGANTPFSRFGAVV